MRIEMIPAGYEKKKKFEFYDSEDDDDDFVFEFADSKPKACNFTTAISSNTEVKSETLSPKNNKPATNSKEIVYECNNKYFYDEQKYLIDDLQHAIIQKNLELVKKIFTKNNFDVNISMKTNWIPIMYAVSVGSYEITEYLIDNQADIFYDDESFSVLLCACGCIDNNASPLDLEKIIKLLISKGAGVNSCDKYFQTPLMYACRSNNIFLIKCLIELGAEIDTQDDNEWTALAHASSKGHLKCVHKLLQLGADPTIYTYDYLYPFDLAQNSGYYDVNDLIKRFIRVKKIENIKNKVVNVAMSEISVDVDDGFESLGDEDDSSVCQKKKSLTKDLESFLNALNLYSLSSCFKSNNVSMVELLNFNEDDLMKIGISDSYTRELILFEVKRFHQKNWKSSSLVPIRQDFNINCNEVIAIVSNLSRHTDYMSTNVKYIASETKKSSCDLLTDKFLGSRLLTELKETLKNSRELLSNVESYCALVEQGVKDTNADPVDLVESSENKTWFSKPLKLAAMSTFGIIGVASTMYYIKKKLF